MLSKVKNFFTDQSDIVRDNRWIFISMLVGASLSLLAALVLSVEAVELARNPGAVFSCDVNSIVSCGTVARTIYSAMFFGIPNGFLGLISEPVIMTIAVLGLAGIKFPKPFMLAAQMVCFLGFLFAYYLFFIGLIAVHAVCPWCLVVTVTTTIVFFSMLRYNIREDNLYLPHKISKIAKQFIKKDFDRLLGAFMIFMIFAILIIQYGNNLFI